MKQLTDYLIPGEQYIKYRNLERNTSITVFAAVLIIAACAVYFILHH